MVASFFFSNTVLTSSTAVPKNMYYCLIYRPQIDFQKINLFKEKYDPYYPGIGAHITLVFPVPSSEVSEEKFEKHIREVLIKHRSFEVHLSGFEKSMDHWLFLSIKEGNKEITKLHDDLYTSFLKMYMRDDLPFSPHIGIGLFTNKELNYDLKNPTILALDKEKYEKALKEAESLNLDYRIKFDKVSFLKVEKDLRTIVFEREISFNS